MEIGRASIPAERLRMHFFSPTDILGIDFFHLKKVINNLLAHHKTLKNRFHPLQLLQFFTDVSVK